MRVLPRPFKSFRPAPQPDPRIRVFLSVELAGLVTSPAARRTLCEQAVIARACCGIAGDVAFAPFSWRGLSLALSSARHGETLAIVVGLCPRLASGRPISEAELERQHAAARARPPNQRKGSTQPPRTRVGSLKGAARR